MTRSKKKHHSPSEGAQAQQDYRDFIPYYSHFSPHTLLTKNGELLQIIKISANKNGLNYESGDEENATVRDVIRRALLSVAQSDRYAFTIHTLRKRTPIHMTVKAKQPFARDVQDRMQKRNRFKFSYYNEIYITILHDGQQVKLLDQSSMQHVIFPARNRKWRGYYLDAAYNDLNETVNMVLAMIAPHYHAQRLGLSERIDSSISEQPVFFSEPMEFLGYLLNLNQQAFPAPQADLSSVLLNHKITFGYNAIESKLDKKRQFAALLSLKQYREMPARAVDQILQLPLELILTESMHFISNDEAMESYVEQKELFEYSGDSYAQEVSEILDMTESCQGLTTDFIKHQVSVAVVVDEYKRLDEEVTRAHQAFAQLGLITIREDLKLEECYWSQLPGNFEFLRRGSPLPTTRAGGFARLNLFTTGRGTDLHWGEAFDMMPTIVNSPYFFNFHYNDNGHSLLLDFNSFHDNICDTVSNYFITTACKFEPRIYVFDRRRASFLTINTLGGNYHSLDKAHDVRGCNLLRLNPLSLEDTPRNRSFIAAWCNSIIAVGSDTQKQALTNAINDIFSSPPEERHLLTLQRKLAVYDSTLAAQFAPYLPGGVYAGIFDAVQENVDWEHGIHGFDVEQIIAQLTNPLPVFIYLIHRIVLELDGRPTFIFLQECWDLIHNDFFAARLQSLLEMLTQNNAMILFHTSKAEQIKQLPLFNTLLQSCVTRIILPDDVEHDYDLPALAMNNATLALLKRLDRPKGDMLVLQKSEATAIRLHFKDMDEARSIFSNDLKTLITTGGAFAKLPEGF